jgi:hypothetical protein
MRRVLLALPLFLTSLTCGAGPPAIGARTRLGTLHESPIAAKPLELWGKDDAPPGLGPAAVEAFVKQRARELRRDCWDQKFKGWERARVEYGLAVDPSGTVLPAGNEDALSKPAAGLERDGARESSPELAQCVERHVDAWTFPRATMPTFMLLRFAFDQPAADPSE